MVGKCRLSINYDCHHGVRKIHRAVTELTVTCHRFDVTELTVTEMTCYRYGLSPIWLAPVDPTNPLLQSFFKGRNSKVRNRFRNSEVTKDRSGCNSVGNSFELYQCLRGTPHLLFVYWAVLFEMCVRNNVKLFRN